jgi:hypothetical protein
MLGFIPSFLDEGDPRPAKEQINTNYIGGWNPIPGFVIRQNGNLGYPDDPDMHLLAEGRFRDEVLRFYECELLGIKQPNGTWEIARLD